MRSLLARPSGTDMYLGLGKVCVWWVEGVHANAHCVHLQPHLEASKHLLLLFYLTLLICIQMPLCQSWSELIETKLPI